MTTLTAPDELREAVEPTDRARLRVRRGGRLDRTVPLADGRCTIGSSPRCQLRLPAPEAQPLQCLIALELGSAEVTRWAAGVLLNGRDFARQKLTAGDRLTIGAWELEWQPGAPDADSGTTAEKLVSSGASNGHETVDFDWVRGVPASTVRPEFEALSQPLPVVATPTPVSTDDEAVVPPAAPVSAPRETAKTLVVSSRQTALFDHLLGPAKPAALEPLAAEENQNSKINSQAATFQDRLVQQLWTRSSARRERLRAVIGETRKARTRIKELTASLARLEQEAAADRSAAEAGAAQGEQRRATIQAELASAVAERDQLASELAELRAARPRTAPPDPRLQTLADELAAMTEQAAALREQLAEREAELSHLREQADAAIANRDDVAEQGVDREGTTSESNADWDAERAELKRLQAIADDDADRLRDQLYACESQIEVLREQLAGADATRGALAEHVTLLEQQQAQWLAECQELERDHAETLAALTDQRDLLQRRVDELTSGLTSGANDVSANAASGPTPTPPPSEDSATSFAEAPSNANRKEPVAAALDAESADAWQTWESAVGECSWSTPPQAEPESAVVAPTWGDAAPAEARDAADSELQAAVVHHDVDSGPQATTPAEELSPVEPSDELLARTPLPPAAPPEAPAAPERPQFTPTSFIDKYRHLLDDSGDAEPAPPRSRQLLDEEYLPSKASGAMPAGDEDADEALEAYMSNLMRRVRGDSPTAAAAAAAAAARFMESPAEEPEAESLLVQPAVAEEPPIEVDANGMHRLARRQPVDTNLAALREIANASARTAIARHRQSRHVEAAVSKGVICALASGASAFLMLTAPDTRGLWFWGGCITLTAAAGSGAQLAVILWQRLSDRRRHRKSAKESPAATNETLVDPGIAAYEPAARVDAAT